MIVSGNEHAEKHKRFISLVFKNLDERVNQLCMCPVEVDNLAFAVHASKYYWMVSSV